MRAVRVIPAIRDLSTGQPTDAFAPKRRVAGYARVSTDSEDQYSSYEAQVDYYTTMIKANAEWEFVGIYTDEGISGTSTNRREGFNRMIDDALAGKIDLIVTKSVSRFARNTVDSLQTIRKLKEHKVEVSFEKEGIRTFDSKGEVPQYYVQDNHEAIIKAEVFDLVQKEIEYRSKHVETTRGSHIFSGRIKCGHCGDMYGSKIWHSTSKYRKVVWQCNGRYVDRYHKCPSPNLTEAEVKQRFVKAVNQLVGNKDEIIRSFEAIKDSVFDSSDDEAKLNSLETERLEIIRDMDRLTAENASTVMDQAVYRERHERLSDRYHGVESEISEVKHAMQNRQYRKTKAELFLKSLRKQEDVVTEFSDHLWYSLADHAEVHGKEDVRFTFKNGMGIKV